MTRETNSAAQVARELANKIEAYAWDDDMRFLQKTVPLIQAALLAARNEALDSVLAGIQREQDYREYRLEKGDQDGSAVGACKEIAGYVRALRTEAPRAAD